MFGFFKKKKSAKSAEDVVANLSVDDEVLQSYQEKAAEGIAYLIDFMNDHEKDDELFQYAVKVKFEEDGNAEHMWVQVNEFSEGYFIGKLANKPSTMKLIKYGDPVNVLKADVEDWVLRDLLTNTKVGGFSSQYIRNVKQNR